MWEVEATNEFKEWWDTLAESVQDSISAVVALLEERELCFLFHILLLYLILVTRTCGNYAYSIEATQYGFSMRLTHVATQFS